ncbi:MAG: cupin domain-containing protein, partial [Bdellovibrionota bacterium]
LVVLGQQREHGALQPPAPRVQTIRGTEMATRSQGAGQVQVIRLLPTSLPGIEMERMILPGAARMSGVPHLRDTKEFLYCLSGEVEVTVSGRRHRVAKGDLVAFPGDLPHAYRNSSTGNQTADCISVVVLAPGT